MALFKLRNTTTELEALTDFTDVQVLQPGSKFLVTTYLHQQPFAKSYSKDMLKKDGVERVLGTGDASKTFEQAYEEGGGLGKAKVIAAETGFYSHHKAGSPYGLYNWEIEFHLPLLIANRLSQTQRFEEAQRWYHFIFNPTKTEDGNAWIFKPFKDERFDPIEDLLSDNDYRDFEAWFENPFLPHVVATFRTEAYMMYTLMKYLDNLIEWGDHLFRRDTIESINEATQYYMLASAILGPKPKAVPKQKNAEPLTYGRLTEWRRNPAASGSSSTGSTVDAHSSAERTSPEISGSSTLFGIVRNSGYFAVPANKKLLEYWDRVADRLFKIRNCRNIDGIVRELPLFEPPIDPALLIRAAQAGLSIESVLNDIHGNLPHYRFQVMLQKAGEYCNEVKALGNALLSALEKKDGEQLGIIRARHEKNLLDLIYSIKNSQKNEAEQAMEGLRINHSSATNRYRHYEKMLGNTNASVPAYKKDSIVEISDAYPQGFTKVKVLDENSIKIISEEKAELQQNEQAETYTDIAQTFDLLSSFLGYLPNFNIMPVGVGTTWGSSNIMSAFSAYSSSFRALAAKSSNQAAKLSKTGSWILRQDEWMQQSRAAALEINQLKRQMLAAEIRTEIAQKEIDNHEQQILNAREVLDFITGDESVVKFTSNATLYNWMAGQLILLHRQAYKMAHDLARQAERCYRHEMGLTDSHFIKSDYWDDDHKGLLAGDRLSNALKQMEKDYLDKNERDFEITKHISLNQLDPLALLNLREGGTCKFAIPEDLFDLDFPGHYFRRIKSVSISIPCVAGPYTSVNATLRLEENLTRISVEELATDDQRFRRGFNGIKSIATSSGQNDSGMFELNFRDERYLPFEGAGAISTWSLEMMEDKNLRQFDYDTIADVIVHLRYTAREDDNWKSTVLDHSTGIINKLRGATLSRLFSLRHDFPNEWHRWTKGTDETLRVRLEKRYFPYFVQAWDLKFSQAELHPVLSDITPTPAGIFENNDELTVSNLPKTVRDCYVIVHYSISPPDGSDDEGSGGDITGPGGDPPGGPDPPGGSTLILPAAALRLRATENVPNTTGTGARFRLNLPATLPDPANLLVFATAEFDAAAPSQYNKANFVTWANNAWWLNTPDTTTALTAHVAAVPLSGTTIAFRHIATASTLYEPDSNTISEKYATSLDHPALNDHPAAILFVTSVRGNNGAGETDKDRHVAVWYDPEKKKWAVVFPSQYGIPVGTQFNVLIGNGSNAFRHTVTAGSVHRDWASVSLLPPAVGQDKVVLLTEYWPFSQLVTGTQNVLTEVNKALFNLQWFPEYSRWGVFALVHAPAKVGMQFNVWVL